LTVPVVRFSWLSLLHSSSPTSPNGGIEAEGFRDKPLHQLATMLHDETPLHR
jgi:hypothetical protein